MRPDEISELEVRFVIERAWHKWLKGDHSFTRNDRLMAAGMVKCLVQTFGIKWTEELSKFSAQCSEFGTR